MTGQRGRLRLLIWPLLLLPALRAGAAPQQRQEVEEQVRLRQMEAALLHRQVDLGGLRQWDQSRRRWIAGPPAAEVLVVNLWATYCGPCVAEMPIVHDIAAALAGEAGLAFAMVSEDEEETMIRFLRDHADRIPLVPQYQSTQVRLRAGLQNDMKPITLLLDRRRVVRQAFAGSLRDRRNELIHGIEGLLYGTRARAPAPPLTAAAGAGRVPSGQQAAPSWEAQQAYRTIEASLLHRQIDLRGALPCAAGSRRRPQSGQPAVVFAWSPRCPACAAELPLLRQMVAAFRLQHLRLVPVAGSAPPQDRVDRARDEECYIERDGLRALWPDRGGALHSALLANLDARLQEVEGPLVLLLDPQMVIRQAIVGTVSPRRNELVGGIERLWGALHRRQAPQRVGPQAMR